MIFEACSFQDITGQRIAKVVETLQHIEDAGRALRRCDARQGLRRLSQRRRARARRAPRASAAARAAVRKRGHQADGSRPPHPRFGTGGPTKGDSRPIAAIQDVCDQIERSDRRDLRPTAIAIEQALALRRRCTRAASQDALSPASISRSRVQSRCRPLTTPAGASPPSARRRRRRRCVPSTDASGLSRVPSSSA